MFNGELGLQFALQVASHYTTSELVELAELGAQSGFHEVWLSDALRYRNIVGWRRRSLVGRRSKLAPPFSCRISATRSMSPTRFLLSL